MLSNYNALQNSYDSKQTEFNSMGYDNVMAAYSSSATLSEELLQQAFEKMNEITAIGNQMRDISIHAVQAILADTVLNTDLLKEWYTAIRTPIAKYSLAETHFQIGDLADADAVLAEIPTMFNFSENEMTEHDNYLAFHNLKKLLKESNRLWPELTEAEIAELQNIAIATDRRSATMAKGVLCFFYNICLEDGADIVNRNMQQSNGNSKGIAGQIRNEVLVYPNPTSGEVELLNSESEISHIAVYDLLGKQVFASEINTTSGKVNIAHLNKGVYFIRIYLSNNEVINKKLIKQ
jgi:hypothetical protein